MKLVESNLHFISGIMVGIEILGADDFPFNDGSVRWGVVLDIGIIRIMIIYRDTALTD